MTSFPNLARYGSNVWAVTIFDKNQNGQVEIVISRHASIFDQIKHMVRTKTFDQIKYVDSSYLLVNDAWVEKKTGHRTSLANQIALCNIYEDNEYSTAIIARYE